MFNLQFFILVQWYTLLFDPTPERVRETREMFEAMINNINRRLRVENQEMLRLLGEIGALENSIRWLEQELRELRDWMNQNPLFE